MNSTAQKKQAAEESAPRDIPHSYYDFEHYVSKERMITYWHQVNEILLKGPSDVLEVGIGSRIVASILRSFNVRVTTADINPALSPDVVTPIAGLDEHFKKGQFPFVLCARVLQHLPFADFEASIERLGQVSSQYLLLTLPVETLRLYVRLRATGGRPKTLAIPLPLFIKTMLSGRSADEEDRKQNFWKIGQTRETSLANVKSILSRQFSIEKTYQVPEDMSHAFFLLRKK